MLRCRYCNIFHFLARSCVFVPFFSGVGTPFRALHLSAHSCTSVYCIVGTTTIFPPGSHSKRWCFLILFFLSFGLLPPAVCVIFLRKGQVPSPFPFVYGATAVASTFGTDELSALFTRSHLHTLSSRGIRTQDSAASWFRGAPLDRVSGLHSLCSINRSLTNPVRFVACVIWCLSTVARLDALFHSSRAVGRPGLDIVVQLQQSAV